MGNRREEKATHWILWQVERHRGPEYFRVPLDRRPCALTRRGGFCTQDAACLFDGLVIS